jgi:hypothetical protein
MFRSRVKVLLCSNSASRRIKVPNLAEGRLIEAGVCFDVTRIGDKRRTRSVVFGSDIAGNGAGLKKGHVPVLDKGHLAKL